MGAHGDIRALSLPFGLPDGRGGRHRRAVLGALNGRGELEAAGGANPYSAVNKALLHALEELGPLVGAELSLGAVHSLLPMDRDLLLVELISLTFGERQFVTVRCPAEGCQAPMDIQVNLGTVKPDEIPASERGLLDLDELGVVAFRLPTVGDQAALHGLSPMERQAQLLTRCLVDGEGARTPRELLGLTAEEQGRIAAAILQQSPTLGLLLTLECLRCGAPFTFEYDPVATLRERLFHSRRELLQEIHHLAFHYSWSQEEILSLDRGLRREYLSLLEQHFDGRRSLI